MPVVDGKVFPFCDPSRWTTSELRTVWEHWEKRQQKKKPAFAFKPSAIDAVKTIRDSSQDGDDRLTDSQDTFSEGQVNDLLDDDIAGSNKENSNRSESPKSDIDSGRSASTAYKQQKVGLHGGRVVIDKDSGYADIPPQPRHGRDKDDVVPVGLGPPEHGQQMVKVLSRQVGGKVVIDKDSGYVDIPPQHRLNQDKNDVVPVGLGPPEPGQQRVKVTSGKVVIDRVENFKSISDGSNAGDSGDGIPTDSPRGSTLSHFAFLDSLCSENEWKDLLKVVGDIPVCFICR